MAFIRQMAQANAESGGGLMDAIGTIFLNPIVMALQPIVACDVWYGKKSKKLLILNVIILFFRTLTDGSRSTLIYFAFHFFIAFILYFGKRTKRQKEVDISKDKKKKNKKIVRVMIIVAIFFIVLTTISRSGNSAVRYAYLYFTMEPYMMEIWASKVDAAGLAGYGLASTNGFSFFVLYLLKNFRVLSDYPMFWHTINNIIAETESQWQIITSTGTMANAYVSLFWYFYLDGGVIGIIVGSFVYGGFCAKYYWNAMKNMSPRTVAIYCFIIQGLFMSFVRFQFGNITYATAFVVLMLAYKRSNKR
jgi:oligosaccharide repeat unit polymerase